MEIGIGVDGSLGLTFDEERQIAREAVDLGYTSMWTPEGAGYDSFQLCSMRWAASRERDPAGLITGIAFLLGSIAVVGQQRPLRVLIVTSLAVLLFCGALLALGSEGLAVALLSLCMTWWVAVRSD